MHEVLLYTDGSCSMKHNRGGYGAVLICERYRKELHGGFFNTTNNRMELKAVIEGLKSIKAPCSVTVYSDSKYVTDSVNKKWIYKWKNSGWKYSKNSSKQIKNADLWKELYIELHRHDLNFVWIKGHSGIIENERADQLAKIAHGMKQDELHKDRGHRGA